jgi:hypothetical protein
MTTDTTETIPKAPVAIVPMRVDAAGAPDGWRGPQASSSRTFPLAPTATTPPARATPAGLGFSPCTESFLHLLLTACLTSPWTRK